MRYCGIKYGNIWRAPADIEGKHGLLRASCAIFTKYMIHRFIKQGKCFVTNFPEKYFFSGAQNGMQEIMQLILQLCAGKNAIRDFF
jgi:hypothetical protein